jgi:hypothetical protein
VVVAEPAPAAPPESAAAPAAPPEPAAAGAESWWDKAFDADEEPES